MRMAGDSRVSLVSALNAKPSTPMRFPLTVPNRLGDHHPGDAVLLPLVEADHLLPVGRHLRQTVGGRYTS